MVEQQAALRLPQPQVACKRVVHGLDVGRGHFERKRQPVEAAGELECLLRVLGLGLPPAFSHLEQVGDCCIFTEHVERDGGDLAMAGTARGDEHLAALELGEQTLHSLYGFHGVHVVNDEQPARVLLHPAEHGHPLHLRVASLGVVLAQVKGRGLHKPGKVGFELGRRVATDKEQGVEGGGVAPGVFDGEAGFADAAQAGDGARPGLCNGRRTVATERLLNAFQFVFAALEEVSYGEERQVAVLAVEAHVLVHLPAELADGLPKAELILLGEGLTGVADRVQIFEQVGLGVGLRAVELARERNPEDGQPVGLRLADGGQFLVEDEGRLQEAGRNQ